MNPDVVSNSLDLIAFLLVTHEILEKIRAPVRNWLIVVELVLAVIATLILVGALIPALKMFGFNAFFSVVLPIIIYAVAVYLLYYFVDKKPGVINAGPTRISRNLLSVGVGMFLVARMINIAHALKYWK